MSYWARVYTRAVELLALHPAWSGDMAFLQARNEIDVGSTYA